MRKLSVYFWSFTEAMHMPLTCAVVANVLHARFAFPSLATTVALILAYQLYVKTVYKDEQ